MGMQTISLRYVGPLVAIVLLKMLLIPKNPSPGVVTGLFITGLTRDFRSRRAKTAVRRPKTYRRQALFRPEKAGDWCPNGIFSRRTGRISTQRLRSATRRRSFVARTPQIEARRPTFRARRHEFVTRRHFFAGRTLSFMSRRLKISIRRPQTVVKPQNLGFGGEALRKSATQNLVGYDIRVVGSKVVRCFSPHRRLRWKFKPAG